jgi:hypothetical protein
MMGFVIVLHEGLANMAWMFFLVIGVWGLVRAFRGQEIDGSYLGAVAIGQGLFILQGIIGVILWANGRLSALGRPEVHILYGAFVIVFLPFIYFSTLQGDNSNRGQWVMAFSNLFLFGVALRFGQL